MVYSIGEVAKMLNVSPQALRNWENQRLILKPQRRPTNRREYTDDDIKAIQKYLDARNQENST